MFVRHVKAAGASSFLVLVSFTILSLSDENIVIFVPISYRILLTEIVAIFNMMAATVSTGAGLSIGYMDFTFAAFLYQLSRYRLVEVLIRPGDTLPYLHTNGREHARDSLTAWGRGLTRQSSLRSSTALFH